MPRGLDPVGRQLPISHNPLNRVVSTTPTVHVPNPLDVLREWLEWFLSSTGIDLATPEQLVASFVEVLGGIFGATVGSIADLTAWVGTNVNNAISMVRTGINQIGDVFNGLVVTPISTAVQQVSDWFHTFLGFQENTDVTQINLQNFQITAQTSGTGKPLWECRYPIADVTFPEFFLTYTPVQGATGAASTGTAHTHAFSGAGAYSAPGAWDIGPAESMGGYVTASTTTVFDTVGMILSKSSAGSINNVYLEVFREALDGSLTRVSSVDISSSLTTSYLRIEAPVSGLVVQAHERYVIRIRNSSTVANTVYAAGVWQAPFAFDTSNATTNATDTNKTSITAAEAVTFLSNTDKLPFAFLAAANLALTDRSVSDDFNRSALGGLYSLASNTGSDQLAVDGTRVVYTGTASGHQNGIHITSMAGDANRVEGDVGLNPFASAGSQEAGFLLHCNRDFSQVVFLGVNTGFATIYSGSITSLTQRAQIASGGSGKWSMYYDVTNDKYVVLKNGSTIGLQWAGVSTAVSHGRDFRYGGFRIEQVTLITAGVIDNFTLRDWTP